MSVLYLYRGLPGCGKTTAARTLLSGLLGASEAVRSNRDCLRDQLHPALYRDSTETHVSLAQQAMVREFLSAGISAVCDDTNLKDWVMFEWERLAKGVRAKVEVIDMTSVPLAVCIEQDRLRPWRGYPPFQWEGAQVGEQVIRDMHARYIGGA